MVTPSDAPASASAVTRQSASNALLPRLWNVIQELLHRGAGSVAMGQELLRAIASGVRDANELTNRVFFALHPQRGQRPLSKSEPNFAQLSGQWLAIRDRLVRPALLATAGQRGAPHSGASATATPAISSGIVGAVERYRPLAEAAARKYGVDPALILGVIAAESGGNKDLVAKSGYTGLMQADKGEVQKRPEISIDVGTRKLRDFRAIMEKVLMARGQRYERLPEAEQLRLLALAYNAGPVTVAKALQYAAEAGRPERWLDPEHYKRALLFTGAYSLKQAAAACLKGLTTMEQESRRREAVRVWNQWRLGTKKVNWRQLKDPPLWHLVSASLPPFVVCAIDFKHRNTPKYAAKILSYRDRFRSP